MSQITLIYGSTTGTTQAAAAKISEMLGASCVDIASAKPEDFQSPVLVLGTSTWGFGELQDDWEAGRAMLESADLSNSKVAFFGFGDQAGFGDTFVDGIGILCEAAVKGGAKIIGKTSADGYSFSASRAMEGGQFCGLALDDSNQSDLTDARIEAWVAQLKSEM